MMAETVNDEKFSRGPILWQPSAEQIENSTLSRYRDFVAEDLGVEANSYAELHAWSTSDLAAFWQSVLDFYGVELRSPCTRVLNSDAVWGARWFEGATLNYAEQALGLADRPGDETAIVARCEDGSRHTLDWNQLRVEVRRMQAVLQRLGVNQGDRVVGYLPNAPTAVIAFLATVSLGAIWSGCPPEFGAKSVLDRFRQIEPKVLLAVDHYRYGGKVHDRGEDLRTIVSGLSTLTHVVLVDEPLSEVSRYQEGATQAALLTDLHGEVAAEEESPLNYEAVPFEHPLWILYSSGTTGLPKPIVHGHGGILLEQLKQAGLQSGFGPGDRFFWFSTTGWMMWNYLVGGLLLGSTIVLYDGNPGFPDISSLWRMAEEEKLTYFGTSAPFLMACRKAGLTPKDDHDLSALQAIGSTGAPLPEEGFEWVYEAIKGDLLLASISGGTDLCTAFLGSSPWHAVRAGELQCASLGAKVEAFSDEAKPLIGEVGELVLTKPMPSMPIYFWGDPEDKRYHESYFEHFPGIWRHGDWISIYPDGGTVIHGRSDSTLNRGGVRMGTSEFYRVVEGFEEVVDSLVVDTSSLNKEGELWLFLVLRQGLELDESLLAGLRSTIRAELSPRHIPDAIFQIAEVPCTLSGKKLEVPIKRIVAGTPLEKAVNPGTLKNPEALYSLLDLIGDHGSGDGAS